MVALRRLRDELSGDMDRIIMLLQAKQIEEVQAILDGEHECGDRFFYLPILEQHKRLFQLRVDEINSQAQS